MASKDNNKRGADEDLSNESKKVNVAATTSVQNLQKAYAQLLLFMASRGVNTSDGCCDERLQNDKSWSFDNVTLHYTYAGSDEEDDFTTYNEIAHMSIKHTDGTPITEVLFAEAKPSFREVELALLQSYNEILAVSNNYWIEMDGFKGTLADPTGKRTGKQLLTCLFNFKPLELKEDGTLFFKFEFRGSATNCNGWVPHQLSKYLGKAVTLPTMASLQREVEDGRVAAGG